MDADSTFTYNESGTSSFSTARSYTYSNSEHVQMTQLTEANSDGTQRITRMKYPADYATGSGNAEASALTAMKSDSVHMHSAVIERWVSDKAGTTERVLQADITSFKAYASGQYLPYQWFRLNSASPLTNFAPSSVSSSFTRDSRYLLQETADSADAFGRVRQLTDARGKVTKYQYGGNLNNAFLTKITRVKDGTGSIDLVTDFGYDTNGNLSSIKDEGGTFRYFMYDGFGRLRQVKNHGSTVLKAYGYTYSRTSGNGWTFSATNPNAVIDTTFQAAGVPIVSTGYLDGLGRPIQIVLRDSASYHVTAQQYDAMGREWRKWKPYTRTTAGYDASFATNATNYYNTDLGVTNAKPFAETLYAADTLARPKTVIPEYTGTSAPYSTTYAYGVDAVAKQRYTEITDELGNKTRSYTDVFGNQVTSILGHGTADSTRTRLAYNVLGQRTQATDPRGIVTAYTLDTRGLLTTRTNPDAGNRSHKYDKAGNLRYSQNANQSVAGQVYFTTYDFAGRPFISGIGNGTFASLDPDAVSAPTLETNTANWMGVRQYDAKPTNTFPWSQFWTQISPLTLSNVAGRLAAVATKSNGAWQVELLSYDTDGRVANRYVYTQNNAGSAVWTALNTTVTYTRDLRDSVTQRVVTTGSNSFYQWYDYDGRGLLQKVFASTTSTKPATADVTYTYRPGGATKDRQFQGGPLVPFRYTIREQLERIGDPALTTYPFSARYAYHPNGTVSESEFYSAGSPATYKRYRYQFGTASYDALNRLKSADYAHWTGAAWASTLAHDLTNIQYDRSGNLTALQRYKETAALIDNLTYTYPAGNNRLSSTTDAVSGNPETWDARTGSFTYDANGNLKTSPAPYSITAATYDHANLPLSTTRSVTTAYRYNAAGQRIAKQTGNGNIEVYLLDGASTLGGVTLNSSGTPTSWYFNLLAEKQVMGRHPSSGARKYYYTDMLGSTRAVVEGTTVVESRDYDPWGLLLPGRTLGSGTKEGFTGKEQDTETGLDYFGARLYMPALGRWTSVDPPADSFPGWSPYNYVYNNPASYTDSFGLNPIGPIVARVMGWILARGLPLAASAGKLVIEALKPGAEPSVDNLAGAAGRAADAAQSLRPRPGAAAALEAGGQVFTATSGRRTLNPAVQALVDAVPATSRSPFHGACAEVNCLSAAADAGVDLAGGTISVVRVRAPGNPVHGTPMNPCATCNSLLDWLGIKH